MEEIIPIAFLPGEPRARDRDHGFNSKLDFGLLADYDAMPDLEAFGGYLEDSLEELLKVARKQKRVHGQLEQPEDGHAGSAKKRTPAQ